MSRKHIIFTMIGIVALMAFVVINQLPASKGYQLTGVITSKGTAQGYGTSGDRLTVEIENGNEVLVRVNDQTGVKVGDRVLLSAFDRHFVGPKYQLLKRIYE